MVYEPPVYPTTIPTTDDLPDRVDDVDWLYAARFNELKKELRAVLAELGTLPKGAYATVKARLDAGISLDSPVFTTKITTPIIDLTGGQIAFPASQDASADPNTMDDYEEGVFGSADADGILAAGVGTITCDTYYSCKYIKSGVKVHVQGLAVVSAVDGQSGSVRIPLPFAVDTTAYSGRSYGTIHTYKVDYTGSYLVLQANQNSSVAQIQQNIDDGAANILDAAGISVGDQIGFQLNYMATE